MVSTENRIFRELFTNRLEIKNKKRKLKKIDKANEPTTSHQPTITDLPTKTSTLIDYQRKDFNRKLRYFLSKNADYLKKIIKAE